ncbi:nuclear transport factor 2 family protein [Roseofilum reptotaenium CS-1145]|uniref:Ketosteroid isomerase n=1 Tax=Roseofilum reptotaenium AO1-A TaxID=1925591 RepID=A0A1L9QSA7_9CYAN|nr:nuclear transport factor 2 family protein [Roseofilum reptotaenium]MDB9518263.1 nuclear transport factor 2 family protein [Roseofilum reptotaenium CS-1145]OJJ25532.1 ketosteroid isomerase [Roseofilum reptotaenium AO1-A]
MSPELMQTTLKGYFTQMSAMNPEGWSELFTPDATIADPVGKPPVIAHEKATAFFQFLAQFYDRLEITPETPFISGTGAAVKWQMNVIAKTGKTAQAEGISVFEFNEAGKITALASYWDEPGLIAQLKGS